MVIQPLRSAIAFVHHLGLEFRADVAGSLLSINKDHGDLVADVGAGAGAWKGRSILRERGKLKSAISLTHRPRSVLRSEHDALYIHTLNGPSRPREVPAVMPCLRCGGMM